MSRRAQRKRTRTIILAILACAALFWGAVDIAGVPAKNLWRHVGGATLALFVVMFAAAGGAALMTLKHRRRQGKMPQESSDT